MTLLAWRSATPADVASLNTFVCCPKESRTKPYQLWKHTMPWAYEAQQIVRGSRPCRPPKFLAIGCDDDGVGAAAGWMEDTDGAFVMLQIMAVASRLHKRRVGDEMLEYVTQEITDRSILMRVPQVKLQANVHKNNVPCRQMVERWGFNQVDTNDPFVVVESILLIAGAD